MEQMIYTPNYHIPIAKVSYTAAEGIQLSFKKPNSQVFESVTMDKFLGKVYEVARTLDGQTTQAR